MGCGVGCFDGRFVGLCVVASSAVGGDTNPLVGNSDGYDEGYY